MAWKFIIHDAGGWTSVISDMEQAQIARGFNVYEHEWKFFAPFTGEPFLIDGRFIAYFDGSVANVCLFGLERQTLDGADVVDLIGRLPFARDIQLLQIWGNFEPPVSNLHDPRLELVDSGMLQAVHGSEFTTDLTTAKPDRRKDARNSLRKAETSGVRTDARQISFLRAEHLRLIREWSTTHDVAPVAALAVASLGHYCSQSHVYVVEARIDGELVGFKVLSRPVPDRVVNMLSFGRRLSGVHIGDALAHESILAARRLGATILHNGYAGTASLANFKRKWGAEQRLPPYRHAIYSSSGEWTARVASGSFHWPLRMLNCRPLTATPTVMV